MSYLRRIQVSLPAITLALGAISLVSAEAMPCTPPLGDVQWSIPQAQDTVSPSTPILIGMLGSNYGREVSLTDGAGANVDFTETTRSMAGLFEVLLEIVPDTELTEGSYTVSLTHQEHGGGQDYTLEFAVGSVPAVNAPGDTTFRWFKETSEEAMGDTCFYDDEAQFVAIDALDPNARYVEVVFVRGDGTEGFQLLPADQANGSLRRYGVTDVECLRVTAFTAAGAAGSTVEVCTPHKCVHHAKEDTPHAFGTVSWDDVDGCGADATKRPAEESGGCATAPGDAPATFYLLLAGLGFAILRRRR